VNRCHHSLCYSPIVIVWFCLVVCLSVGYATAEDDTETLLSKSTDSVWYSVETESIVAAKPESRETIDAEDRKNLEGESFDPNQIRSGSTSSFSDFFRVLFELIAYAWVGILIAIVLLLVGVFVYFLVKFQVYSRGATGPTHRRVSIEEQNRKVTDLPFELEQSQIGLLETAAKFRAQGDYSRAIIYLFSHVLIELDAVGHIRLERGKTNWTYLRELRPRDWERAFTSPIVQWFEHVFFGKNVMDAAAFETIWAALPGFESRLRMEEAKS
jgi:hypothetical protein